MPTGSVRTERWGAGVRRLLIIHHSPSGSVRKLTAAVEAGARAYGINGVSIEVREALDWARGGADCETILAADGYVLVTPANFGYMSGALKHVFDSTFLEIGGALDPSGSPASGRARTNSRPYGLVVHGRYDTVGAVRSVQTMATALGWRLASGIVAVLGSVDEDHQADAAELGGVLAALLMD